MVYTGPVYFGTPLQTSASQSSFIYDTGSGWLVTTSSECSGCTTKYYDPSKSSSVKTVSSETQSIVYGSLSLEGYVDSDTVCLSKDDTTCASDFQFIVITKEDGGLNN